MGELTGPPSARKRLGPGIYDLGDGTVQIIVEEMCAHFGLPATDENVAIAMEGIDDALDALYGRERPPVVTIGV